VCSRWEYFNSTGAECQLHNKSPFFLPLPAGALSGGFGQLACPVLLTVERLDLRPGASESTKPKRLRAGARSLFYYTWFPQKSAADNSKLHGCSFEL
jgi:hypothetical protein